MKQIKRAIVIFMISVALLISEGCTSEPTVTMIDSSMDEVVKIPILLRVEPDSNMGDYSYLISGFNEKYRGQYAMDVTLIAENEQGYRERIKLLNATDELPAIITDASFGSEFSYIMQENDRYHGLYPLGNGFFSSAGIFYNKEIFEKAGINSFPKSWEEFFIATRKIASAGYTPIALHSGGEYWCAMLMASAYAGATKEGHDFLETKFPKTYDTEGMRSMLECTKKIYEYSFEDALEIDFDEAKERFMAGEAAMFPNGYWMVDELQNQSGMDIGFQTYPRNMLMVDDEMSAWAIISGYDEEVTRGAELFMEYRKETTAKEAPENSTPTGKLDAEYRDVFNAGFSSFPNYQLQWKESIINEGFDEYLPQFIRGEITEDDVIAAFDNLP